MAIKVLYIDDEPINLQLFELNFGKEYTIKTGLDGVSGLKILEENPDTKLVISDMKMPGMNGLEFIGKAKEKYPDKKYYILTGFDITPEISSALESGLILEYFSKPFNVRELSKVMSSADSNG